MISLKKLLFETSLSDLNIDIDQFKNGIATVESGGNYQAINKTGSSATGKYQFIWSIWKKDIEAETGITSREEFLNSPDAQEKFMDWVITTKYVNAVKKLKQLPESQNYSDIQLMAMVHFQGRGGAQTYLKTGKIANATNNASMNSYLNKAGFFGGNNIQPITTTSISNDYDDTWDTSADTIIRANETGKLSASIISKSEFDELNNETLPLDQIIKLPKTLSNIRKKHIKIRTGINALVDKTWRGFTDNDVNEWLYDFNGQLNSIDKKYISKIFWGGVRRGDEIPDVIINDLLATSFKYKNELKVFSFARCETSDLRYFWIPTAWIDIY